MLKPKYKWETGLHLTCQGEIRPSAPRQLRQWLWYIVFTYSKLCLRAGGVPWFKGRPASCL